MTCMYDHMFGVFLLKWLNSVGSFKMGALQRVNQQRITNELSGKLIINPAREKISFQLARISTWRADNIVQAVGVEWQRQVS